MSATYDVAAIVGSLRRESYNRRLVNAMIGMAPAALKIQIVEIRDLAFYDQDAEASPPQPWLDFRARIKRADAVLFATPEYNRSVSGVLKNAIDVGSRPYTENVWAKKPAAVMSVSVGAIGGFGANHHLRQSLVAVDMAAMPQPEAYIGGAQKLFDEEGRLTNSGTAEFCVKFLSAFAVWIRRQSALAN